MPIVERRYTVKSQLNVSSADLRLARSGQKVCTIRLGTLGISSDRLFLTDRRDSILVRVTSIDTARRYSELNESDALSEGFDSLEALRADLRRYYGDIDPEQPITVIHFEPGQ